MNRQLFDAILDMAEYHINAGNIEEAKAICRQVLIDSPDVIEALFLLGNIAHREGKYEESVALFTRTVSLDPENPVLLNNLGNALAALNKLDEAVRACRKATALNPGYSLAWYNLGEFEYLSGNQQEALQALKRCTELTPDRAEAYSKLGDILAEKHSYNEALRMFKISERLVPPSPELLNSFGNILKFMGRSDEAIHYYNKVTGYVVSYSNKLLCLLASPSGTPDVTYREHRGWGTQFADRFLSPPPKHANDTSPARPLKIGYVTCDFRYSPVAFFIEPVLASHDRSQFIVHAYVDVPRPDAITEQLRQHVAVWRPIDGLSCEAVADLVREDGIDILIDLAGHTANNRLLVFARKPAPVQVSWLGYAATTGLLSIDYRITDAKADPPGMTEAYHTETLYRLPDSFICYRPAVNAPEVGPLPARSRGIITFAALNHFSKVTPDAIAIWSQILLQVPGSRLMLKSHGLDHQEMQRDVREMFGHHGIAADRLALYGRLPNIHGHLDLFNQVDIALDTFPYNGTTTTCESLWMGVPVITLAGDSHVSRVGVSLLTSVGLQDMIAVNRDDYVARAITLAENIDLLDLLRANLRSMMLRSALLDTVGFTRNLEAAYRDMWRRWCQVQPPLSP